MNDYDAHESREATALISSFRNMHCDRPHPIFGPPCERCLSMIHDGLAKAIHHWKVFAKQAAFNEAAELCHAASTEQVKAGDETGAVAMAAMAAIMEYKKDEAAK